MRVGTIKLTLTETDAFRRLVTFLETIEAHADEHCDLALKDLVEDARSDLAELLSP
jgi:hypothetical protein